jgi:hypothetical protein
MAAFANGVRSYTIIHHGFGEILFLDRIPQKISSSNHVVQMLQFIDSPPLEMVLKSPCSCPFSGGEFHRIPIPIFQPIYLH